MICFANVLAKLIRFGLFAMTALIIVVPAAMAQQAPHNDRLLTADGRPLPENARGSQQDDVDLFDEPVHAAPAPPLEPQDPLNQTYGDTSSSAIDRRDLDRLTSISRDPLREVPRDFRDDRFNRGLVQKNQARLQRQSDTGDWRKRDDTAFDPLGIRTGGFVFYPELYTRMITTNNLFATKSNKKSDYAAEFTPRFRLRSDWNNHELELFGTLTRTNWRNFTTENTTEYELRARGRLDITSRTSFEGGMRYEQKMEGRGSNELPDSASRPAVTTEAELYAQLDHRFNRLGLRLRGQVIRNAFDDVALNSGAIQDNHIRDYDEHLLALRTNYEFSPRFSLFADTGIGERVFKKRRDGGGFLQGSKSWLGAVGTSVEFTSNLNFLGRVGYAKANPDEASLVDLKGIIYDASLIWTPTRLTTVTLKGGTELEETTQTGSPGSINRTVSLELVNSWTHRLTSTLSSEYEVRDYAGIVQTDTELTLGVDAAYLFSRSWVLDAGYEFTLIDGSNAYSANEFHLGLKWRR